MYIIAVTCVHCTYMFKIIYNPLLKVPEPKSVVSHTHRTLSKSAHEMRTENTSNSPTHSQGKKDGSVKDKPGSSSGEVMSDSQLKLATL